MRQGAHVQYLHDNLHIGVGRMNCMGDKAMAFSLSIGIKL